MVSLKNFRWKDTKVRTGVYGLELEIPGYREITGTVG